jgi:site-specific recombinase XerD
MLVNAGRTLYEVQLLGHSDSKVTERYSHLSLETLQAAANSASVAMRGAGQVVVVPEVLEAA